MFEVSHNDSAPSQTCQTSVSWFLRWIVVYARRLTCAGRAVDEKLNEQNLQRAKTSSKINLTTFLGIRNSLT